MDKQDISEYSFVNEIAPVLRDSEQIREAHRLFDIKVDAETIKAFLIHLTISTFGHSKESDIVLMSWGLLKGYENLSTVTARRIKYMTESGNKSKSKAVSKRTPEARSKDYIRKEDKLYKKLYQTYSDNQNEREFIKAARELYLEPVPGEPKIHRVKLPEPSYVKNAIPVADDDTPNDLYAEALKLNIEKPGMVSRKALNVLSELDPLICKLFKTVCEMLVCDKNMPFGSVELYYIYTGDIEKQIDGSYLGFTGDHYIDSVDEHIEYFVSTNDQIDILVDYGLLRPRKRVPLIFPDESECAPNCEETVPETFFYNLNENMVLRVAKRKDYRDTEFYYERYDLSYIGKEIFSRLDFKSDDDNFWILASLLNIKYKEQFEIGLYKIMPDYYDYVLPEPISETIRIMRGKGVLNVQKEWKIPMAEFLDLEHNLLDENTEEEKDPQA